MKLLTSIVFLFGIVTISVAQSVEKHFILSGTISNKDGAAIYGLNVVAEHRDGRTFSGRTNSDGFYEIMMPLGKYTLEVSGDGWRPVILSGFLNTSDERIALDFTHMIGKCADCYGAIYGADISWQDKPIKINYSKQKNRNKIIIKETHH